MGHATYLTILVAMIAGPIIAMLFLPRFRLTGREWRKMLLVFICVSIPFTILDSLQYSRGWWSYNADFVFGGRFMGLPFEEIGFFFAIPFSALYLYSQLAKVPALQKTTGISQRLLASAAMLAVSVLSIVEAKERTVINALLALIIITMTSLVIMPYELKRHDIAWMGVVMLLFLVVSGCLTGLPIVTYNELFGSSLRIGSIPLADGIRYIGLLLSALFVYRYHSRKAGHLSRAL